MQNNPGGFRKFFTPSRWTWKPQQWEKKGMERLKEWEKLFEIVGGGNKVKIHEAVREGKCTIRQDKNDGSWLVGITDKTPTEAALHEACHQLYTPFTLPVELLQQLQNKGQGCIALANALEDARIDKKGGDWYSQDLSAFHRKALQARPTFKSEVSQYLVSAVTNYVHEVGIKQSNPKLQEVLDKFQKQIDDAVLSDNPLTTTHLAVKMWEELNETAKGTIQAEKDLLKATKEAQEHSQAQCDVIGVDGEDEKTRDGEGSLPEKDFAPQMGNKLSEWKPSHRNWTESRASGGHPFSTIVKNYPMEPTIPDHNTRMFIESNQKSITKYMTRNGQPTHKIWRINHGKMNVFEKMERKAGKVLLMVDLSGSMGCWCEVHGKGHSRKESGYLAFQVAHALTSTTDAEVFGFCSRQVDIMIPMKKGQQPLCRDQSEVPGNNPDCAALEFMGAKLAGLGRDAIGIFISDGQPATTTCSNEIQHTTDAALKLYAQGMRFASILVGENFRPIYPTEITAHVGCVEDMKNIQPVIDMVSARTKR